MKDKPLQLTQISSRLLSGLQRLQATKLPLPLVPLNGHKQPLGDQWQHRPFTATALIEAINNGGVEVPIKGKIRKLMPQGFGLLTGRPLTQNGQTYYLMALDQDGESAQAKLLELSGGHPLPTTVAFTSGRPGRCQFLFLVPETYKDALRSQKVRTGVTGDDGKEELLEFRWTNLQSVLPPSVHPTTGSYHWVKGCALDEVEIAIAPQWMLAQMLVNPKPHHPTPPLFDSHKPSNTFAPPQWTETDFAKSYLAALSPYRADDYHEWLTVGMALHSVGDDSLLAEWDRWSQQSAKYQPGDCEKKWKSFRPNGGVQLGTLAHLAKQDGWRFPESSPAQKKPSRASGLSPLSETVTSDSSLTSDAKTPDPLSLSATVSAVTEILKSGLKDYAERHQLDLVQTRSELSKGAFWELVAALRCTLDEVQPEDAVRLSQLIDWHNAALDLHTALPAMADDLIHDASILNIDPICLVQYLLPAVLSLVGQRVDLDAEGQAIPAILWTCLVGESGIGKSRAEKVMLAHLKKLQGQEKRRFLSAKKDYEQACREQKASESPPSAPQPERKYLFEVATIQAVMRRLSEQQRNGSLWARDEIAGLFKSLSQFSPKGEGEGLECLLKMWDGDGATTDRVKEEDSYHIEATRLSVTGSIQPGIYRQIFRDQNDSQGIQARFLYAIPKLPKPKRVKGYCRLSEKLPDLYDWLANCPQGTLQLSPEANARYDHLYEHLLQEAETGTTPAIRAWMRKLPGQLLRITLALHLIEYYHDRKQNYWEIGRDTLERAVEFCRYYRSSFHLVQEKTTDSEAASSILLQIWDTAALKPGGVTPREIYRSIKAIARRAQALGRKVGAYTIELFEQLVGMGRGTLEKSGRSLRFFATSPPPSTPDQPSSPPPPSTPPPPVTPTGDSKSPISPTARTEAAGDRSRDQAGEGASPEAAVPSGTVEKAIAVTEVTEAQSTAQSEVSASPEAVVSPGTVKNQSVAIAAVRNESLSADVSWLMQLLADLETPTAPHPRFACQDSLIKLFNESEKRLENCQEELLAVCPDYFERFGKAFGITCSALPDSTYAESFGKIRENPPLPIFD